MNNLLIEISVEPDNTQKDRHMIVIRSGGAIIGIPARNKEFEDAKAWQDSIAHAFRFGFEKFHERVSNFCSDSSGISIVREGLSGRGYDDSSLSDSSGISIVREGLSGRGYDNSSLMKLLISKTIEVSEDKTRCLRTCPFFKDSWCSFFWRTISPNLDRCQLCKRAVE